MAPDEEFAPVASAHQSLLASNYFQQGLFDCGLVHIKKPTFNLTKKEKVARTSESKSQGYF